MLFTSMAKSMPIDQYNSLAQIIAFNTTVKLVY